MKLSEIRDVLSADVIFGEDIIDDVEVETAFASDLLSDVLAYSKENALFITGLTNPQVIRTAEVLDLVGVVFVRAGAPAWSPWSSPSARAFHSSGPVHNVRDLRAAFPFGHQGVP